MHNQVQVLSPTVYDRKLTEKEMPRSNIDVWIGRWPQIPYLRVCWHTRARFDVLQHCYKTPDVEVGGVILGNIYRSSAGTVDFPVDYIEIEAAIEAVTLDAGVGHVRFTSDSWLKINQERDRHYPDMEILGWYHTHPGHGIFLSGHDLHIHNNFFSQDFQLALLIETHQRQGAFFVDSARQKGPYQSEIFEWDHRLFRQMAGIGPKQNHNRDRVFEERRRSANHQVRRATAVQESSDIEIVEEDLIREADSRMVIEPSDARKERISMTPRRFRRPTIPNQYFVLAVVITIIASLGLWAAVRVFESLGNFLRDNAIFIFITVIILAIFGLLAYVIQQDSRDRRY